MMVSLFLTLGFVGLVALIGVAGFYAFLKRRQALLAVSERLCTMNMPGDATLRVGIRIPVEWRHQDTKGSGFHTHSFMAPDNRGTLTIHIGRNPTVKEGMASRRITRRVGARKVEFLVEATDQGVVTQAIVRGFCDRPGDDAMAALLLHIMIVTRDNSFTGQAFHALGTLKIRE